jgi:hypothetical protein
MPAASRSLLMFARIGCRKNALVATRVVRGERAKVQQAALASALEQEPVARDRPLLFGCYAASFAKLSSSPCHPPSKTLNISSAAAP